MADLLPSVFEGLHEMSWKGISFPTTHLALELDHDLVEHKWPDRDGAHIEATGLCPLVFHATICFRNGASPGKTETWGSGGAGSASSPQNVNGGALYPNVFRDFIGIASDRTKGPLLHPEFGTITCKLKSAHVAWDPTRRDGVDVEATWIQSTETPGDLNKILASPSPISSTLQFALDLDAQIIGIVKPVSAAFEPSFGDAMRSIQAVFDQTSLISKQIGGQIDHVAYRLNSLSDSIAATKDCTSWPITQSIEHLRASLNDLKKQLLVANKAISIYVTPTNTTIGMICSYLGVQIADLIKLNPLLVTQVTVPARSVVRYYG